MDVALAKLLVGLAVKISRSDGRVHSATVKSVDATKCTVHVEWTEKNITKGKEIEIGEMCNLNTDLIQYLQTSRPVASTSSTAPAPKAEKKSELPSRASKIPAPPERHRRMTTRQTCLFRPTAEDAHGQDLPSSAVPRPSDQGISRVPEVNKVNKRLSVSTKISETQVKKGKYGDMNRPNKQFYQMIEEYRETLEKVPLSLTDPVELHRICVCVRKRPLNKKEVTRKEIDVVTVPGKGVLLFHEPKQKVDLTKYLDNQLFHFDYSFDESSTNDLVYRFTAKPLVKTIFEGGRATCFAYGQTGSGKTHTMGGDFSGKAQDSSKGVYSLAAHDVFNLLQQRRYADMDLSPYVTFFEIYNGKVFDLLNKKTKLRVLEDEGQQVQVVGLQEVPVSSVDDVIRLIEKGSACRTSGQTFANTNSSRSHAVLQVILRHGKQLHGKFSLVDLAGNERGTDVSSNDRKTMVETAEINRSLLALKECIRSLGQNSEHIPFRMSKLTQVLRDSFIGENSRTCMIAMISPGMNSCDYTLNTLRYADRVKELNGVSKGAGQDHGTRPEEPTDVCSFLEQEPIEELIQISEVEEKFYEDLQGGREIAKAMQHELFDVVNSLPEIDEYMERLQGSYQALRSAIERLKARSLGME
ncbi:kinesin-like protein KIF2C isoform X2 [Electrophorus electricus]|uniref:Kinesin-like protein n=1 Tax=Electrophorus electricus TaxID=8005 RepID=A0AAY5EUD3_ELEEL|nr:kinesin-like protein KIF2C isoform X2 [Electrophorus electricus]